MRKKGGGAALLASAALVLASALGGAVSAQDKIEDSVVQIFTRQSYPDTHKPWTTQAPNDITGSGVVIEGSRILTNAHMVIYSRQIQVEDEQTGDKVSANVEAIDAGMDLAILSLEDESFFSRHPALPRAESLPEIKSPVMAYGYPTGGNGLSVTKGIVSRIEFVSYNYSVSGLRIQIDAAINPGNSGGPTVLDGKMIGLTFSTLRGGQNIGYIIPDEEIELFLAGTAAGPYRGKPMLNDEFQTLENAALRKSLDLAPDVHGIVVSRPYEDADSYPLKRWDVISRIGDASIDDQGMIRIQGALRVGFQYQLQKSAKDDAVDLVVYRGGKRIHLSMPLFHDRPYLVNWLSGGYPAYFIFGPLVFSEATGDFVSAEVGSGEMGVSALNWLIGRSSPLASRRGDAPAFSGERLVVVSSPLFPSKLAEGYGNPEGEVVAAVDGAPIRNLGHLVEILRDGKGEFVTITFADHWSESIVLPRAEALAGTAAILGENGIRSQGSADMLSIWGKRP
jgi:S1-C subfamily serine protease